VTLDHTLDLQKVSVRQLQRRTVVKTTAAATHFEEPLQPPDLKYTFSGEDDELEDTPPLHSGVGALSCVPVCALADNDVALLVLDLADELG
jgi:hypothetical protein